ncbi:MAG: HEAT repeat domain-containing protein [Planctomycetaceae bacterium]|nr:HEAT repeat domain-containing protein [Planctomycetaceae bacterium]
MKSTIVWLSDFLAPIVIAFPMLQAGAGEFTFGPLTIHVPDGYTIELAAGPPLVDRPIAVARDERGRLYATDSAGMSDKAEKQLEAKPHRIVRLEDRDGDGRYETGSVFADGMMFPEGCLWHAGSLYVAAPPQIWKLTDADDDGQAERREVWFDGKTLTGCANDLHGPYLGRDGWLYWCKGAFAEQRHTLPSGKQLVTRASHIFRARPDGSGLEPVLTGGMDNPVNVAFLASGERILSCTFFQHPEAGRRDGLIHAIYGGVYGKKSDPIYAHKMTGDVMPVLVHEGAAAPCGLTAGSPSLFGGEHADNLFACYFNLHKVVRHTLIADGPTFKTVDEDFVRSDHPDFHPTDVFEDADGSLLVVDTGGWYKVCCPTSQLAKPDVLGAIYRVRKIGAKPVADPLGTKIAWESQNADELAKLLGDSRLFVRERAAKALRTKGEAAIPALASQLNDANPAVRLRSVWALSGIDGSAARNALRNALEDKDQTVAHAAAHVAGLWRDRDSLEPLLKLLAGHDRAVARAAAEAIGRIGDKQAVPALVQAIEQLGDFTPDATGAPADPATRISEHALVYALIEIGDPHSTAAGLDSASPHVRRAALVALDQMEGGDLAQERVIPLLDDESQILRRTGQWIVAHRPEWGEALVGHFKGRLEHLPQAGDEPALIAAELARLAKSEAIQRFLEDTLRQSDGDAKRQVVLKAMAEARLSATPARWFDCLAELLPKASGNLLGEVVATAKALPLPKAGHAGLKGALLAVGASTAAPTGARLAALEAAGNIGTVEPALFELLSAAVMPDEPYASRTAAANVLATAALTPEQRLALADTLAKVGPFELPKLLPAFEHGATVEQGLRLVAALEAASGARGLRAEALRPILAKYPPSIGQAAEKLLAALGASTAEQASQLDQILRELPSGDIRRGHEVFVSQKAACSTCHAVGYLGGRLGPDLTNIAKVRNDRDLMEAIVFPSASFVRSYEPILVRTDDGRNIAGIPIRQSADEIVLATAPQQEQVLARSEVVAMQPGQASLMPQGVANLLSRQELADLLAYLKSSR